MDISQVYRFLFDSLMVVWFFYPLQAEEDRGRRAVLLGWLLMLTLLPLYLLGGSNSVPDIVLRFLLRTLIYSLWAFLCKGISVNRSFYFGLLCWIAFTCENNIFLTPQFSPLRWNLVTYGLSSTGNLLVNRGLELVLEAALITLVSCAVPLVQIRTVPRSRWCLAAILTSCELYVKYTLRLISQPESGQQLAELTVYPILMQALVIISLIMFERYLYHRKLREEARLNEAINQYRYENAITRLNADDDLRRLHHDMKNHLIVLQTLLDDNQKANAYVQDLMQGMTGYEQLVETGNKILNGLLSEKITLAAKDDIDVNACFDFRAGAFMEDMDICAIFGNALDNAIEASRQVKDPEQRSILIKCSVESGNLLLTFINYYEGTLSRQSGLPASTKSGSMHGIGLSSIQRSAKKYGGTMTADTDDYHNFVLTVLIPIPTDL